jgi:dUTP pyrophosphatase
MTGVPIVVGVFGPGQRPRYSSGDAAGADLFASETILLPPAGRAAVGTGLHFEIPPGHVGLVWPRSGIAIRSGIDTLAGVIDSDYRGEVKVVLINHGEEPFFIRVGDRIAQVLFQQVERAEFQERASLSETGRGEGGFGSTGA